MDQEDKSFETPDPKEDKSAVPRGSVPAKNLYRRQRALIHSLLRGASLMSTKVVEGESIKEEDDEEDEDLFSFIVKATNPVEENHLLGKFYVAGGTLTSVFTGAKVNDIDLFFRSEEDLEEMKEKTKAHGLYEIEHISPSAITLQPEEGPRIQLIKRYIGNPEEVINTFDFTISQAAYDPINLEFTLGKDFLRTLAERVLVFNEGSRFPISSLWRAKKFITRGYTLPSFELLKICMSICNLQFDTMASVAEQISVVNPVTMKELSKRLMGMTEEPFDGNSVIRIGEEVLREEAFYD